MPDTIDDEWIQDEAELNERSNSYMSERKAAEYAFSIKCPRTLYPEANLWERCSTVLSRRDIINALSGPW